MERHLFDDTWEVNLRGPGLSTNLVRRRKGLFHKVDLNVACRENTKRRGFIKDLRPSA